VRIVFLADIHFGAGANDSSREKELADILFLRAVHRLNRYIKPDLTVLLGDIIDAPGAPDRETRLSSMAEIFNLAESPKIAVRGNHDPEPGIFGKFFPLAPPVMDIGGVRILTFDDPERPGFNAWRSPGEAARMESAASSFRGVTISVQHTPLFPPGLTDCPYNFTNAEELVSAMRRGGLRAAVGGHFHSGFAAERDGAGYFAVPALCKSPFRFLEMNIDSSGKIETVTHTLALPEPGLTDAHVHTRLAYCNENMDTGKAMRLARLFNLSGLIFCEHSAHLLFNGKNYGACLPYTKGASASLPAERRMSEYLADLDKFAVPAASRGIEMDISHSGKPVMLPGDEKNFSFILGSLHHMASLKGPQTDMEEAKKEFMFLCSRLPDFKAAALAHPFRVFRRGGTPLPEELFDPLSAMLAKNKIAAEINYHTNDPEPAFFRMCLERGVKLVFGSDAHNLYEVGEFYPHLKFLREDCGLSGNPGSVMLV
jgi:histidinol phosphatase-like PHP family hydrolase